MIELREVDTARAMLRQTQVGRPVGSASCAPPTTNPRHIHSSVQTHSPNPSQTRKMHPPRSLRG
jgi:hypothetical protein